MRISDWSSDVCSSDLSYKTHAVLSRYPKSELALSTPPFENHQPLSESPASGTNEDGQEQGLSAPPVLVRPKGALRADVRNLSFWYGGFQALHSVNLPVVNNGVTALIGASGCGKSHLLLCFKRSNDLYTGTRSDGDIMLLQARKNRK